MDECLSLAEMFESLKILSIDHFFYRRILKLSKTVLIRKMCNPVHVGNYLSVGRISKFDASFNEAKKHTIDHFEQSYLTWLISNSKGNVTQAADIAQKERRALGNLLKKHDINPDQYRRI